MTDEERRAWLDRLYPEGPTEPTQTAELTPPVEKGILGTVVDIGKGLLSGPVKEVENLGQSVRDIADFVDNKVLDGSHVQDNYDIDIVPEAITPETAAGRTAQTISAFATGWLAGGKLITAPLRGLSAMQKLSTSLPWAARAVETVAKNGVVDFITGDGTDERLADVLVNNDVLRNGLTEYLASDEDDSWAEARWKNVLEGFLVGGALDAGLSAFKALKKGYKASLRGDVDGSILARKEAAENIVAKQRIAEAGGAGPAREELTERALLQQTREQLQAEGAFLLKKKEEYFNTRVFTDERTAAYIDSMQELIGEKIQKNVPFRQRLFKGAVEYNLSHDADKAFVKENYLSTGALKDVSPDQATANRIIFLDTWLPQHLDKVAQDVTDNAPDALAKARQTAQDVLEIVLDQKNVDLTAGHTSDAKNVAKWGAETGGVYKSRPQGQELIADVAKAAKEAIDTQSDDEILDFLLTYKSMAKSGATPKELMQHVAKLTPGNSALKQSLGLKDSPIWNSIMKFRYGMMLSSLKTQIRAFAGNAARVPLTMVEEMSKAMWSGAIEGAQRGGLSGAGIGALHGAQEGWWYWSGMSKAYKYAQENFMNSIKYGEAIARPANFAEGAEQAAKTYKWADNKLVNAPLKALQAADEFFSTWAGGAKAYQQAMIAAHASGVLKTADKSLRQKILSQYVEEYMEKSFADVVMKDGTVVHGALALKESYELASEAVYQQALTGFMKNFSDLVNRTPFLKVVFPFIKTPANITKDWLWTRNPVVAPFKIYEAYRSKDNAKLAEALTHMTSAVMLWTGAYMLVADGKITGKGPDDPFQRQVLQQMGWSPNSYRTADGTYWSLDAIEPYGSLLGFLATWAEKAQREGNLPLTDTASMMQALAATVRDKTFLKGFNDMTNLLAANAQAGDIIANIPLSFFPGLLRDMGQAYDPVRRETPDFYTKALARTPFHAQLAPKYSWLTGMPIIYNHNGGLGAFFNALNTSKENGDMVMYELSRLSGISDPSDNIGAYKLTPDEYASFCETMGSIKLNGRTLYEALDTVINSDRYQRDIEMRPDPSPYELDANRNDILEGIIRDYRKAAKAQFMRDHPHIAQASAPTALQRALNF